MLIRSLAARTSEILIFLMTREGPGQSRVLRPHVRHTLRTYPSRTTTLIPTSGPPVLVRKALCLRFER